MPTRSCWLSESWSVSRPSLSDSRSIPHRIVCLSQANIRPIVRGKARCNVEFGAKISLSVTGEGFTFLDRLSFDPYNEGEDLKAQTKAYRRHGHYPKVICADQIYRTRANRPPVSVASPVSTRVTFHGSAFCLWISM